MKYETRYGHAYIPTAGFSCAYRTMMRSFSYEHHEVARGNMKQEEYERRMWFQLCTLLTTTEKWSVITCTTDHEPEWRDLLAACPYAKQIDEVQSQHGEYQVQLWHIAKHKRNSE